jgi:chorismate mutase
MAASLGRLRVCTRGRFGYLSRSDTARYMSTALPLEPAPTLDLAALRSELDGIDDALHELLMRRAAVVEQVARTKGGVALRPGREAAIIRRLLARHAGNLPLHALLRIWRELLAATTAMQGNFSITACDADRGGDIAQLAREHFGFMTPLRTHRSPAQAIAEISRGSAAAAVLPMPLEDEAPSVVWWTALLHRDEPRIHVVARLPFWAARTEGTSHAQALVAAPVAPDPSGQDRSLIGLELSTETSRARLTAAIVTAGFAPGTVILKREPGADYARALIDVDGFVADSDPRLGQIAALLRPPVVLGAYAVPFVSDQR